MYRIGDKRSAVMQIQRFLREISVAGEFLLPKISVDGIYGEETKNALIMYQNAKRIPPNGVVDFETTTLLYDDFLYYRTLNNSDKSILGDKNFPYAEGDKSRDVVHINTLLTQILAHYNGIDFDYTGDFYSDKTVEAVKFLQSVMNLEQDGIVSAEFYNKLLDINNSINKLASRSELS